MRRALAGVLAAGVTAAWAFPAYRDGPPAGHTGGFGEPLCAECHFGAPVNDDAGALAIEAPDRYRPGESHRLRVRLARPGMAVAGFQLAVRFADGERAGHQAGTLEPVDARTAVTADTATGVVYAHQTAAGASLVEAGEAEWTVRWVAPTTDATVVVHVAANAANDDASEFGDFIYASERRIPGDGAADGARRGSSGAGGSPGPVSGQPPGPRASPSAPVPGTR